jgi:hypothetical protein
VYSLLFVIILAIGVVTIIALYVDSRRQRKQVLSHKGPPDSCDHCDYYRRGETPMCQSPLFPELEINSAAKVLKPCEEIRGGRYCSFKEKETKHVR